MTISSTPWNKAAHRGNFMPCPFQTPATIRPPLIGGAALLQGHLSSQTICQSLRAGGTTGQDVTFRFAGAKYFRGQGQPVGEIANAARLLVGLGSLCQATPATKLNKSTIEGGRRGPAGTGQRGGLGGITSVPPDRPARALGLAGEKMHGPPAEEEANAREYPGKRVSVNTPR